MPLKKQLLDIPVTKGLAQKIDPRKLPLGTSAMAQNLVVNKMGRLEKSIGLFPLNSNVDTTPAFTPDAGLNVASWQGNPTRIVSGPWDPTTGTTTQQVTNLSSYSDDQGAWTLRGMPPEVQIAQDKIVASSPQSAFTPTSVVVGDYQLIVWLNTGTQSGALFWTAWYCVLEISTGEYAQAPQLVDSATVLPIAAVCACLVGTTVVITLQTSDGTDGVNIRGKTIAGNLLPTVPLSTIALTTFITNAATASGTQPHFIRAITGDTTHFALLYYKFVTGPTYSLILTAWTTAFANTGTISVGGTSGSGNFFLGSGFRADATNGIAVAWFQNTTGSSQDLMATVINYPAFTVKGTATSITNINTSGITHFSSGIPAVGYTGTISGAPSWIVGWSNLGGYFNWGGVNPNAATSVPGDLPVSAMCAAIQTTQFNVTAGAVTPYSNTIQRSTYGVCLTSQWLEANGIVYCLGWIPSQTQGGYLLLACDYANNPTDGSISREFPNPYCLRPCGQIQTRTALNDPTQVYEAALSSAIFINGAINGQAALSEWNLGTDPFSTAYIAYVCSSQGNRTLLASGHIQMTPAAGYPTAMWGNLLCYGGALPTCYDGANLFEQSFLYTIENVIWTNTTTGGAFTFTQPEDAWSWIFTFEQFDNQGNFHLSGRSDPVTITGDMVVGSGSYPSSPMQFRFYIPTQGVTMRSYVWPSTLAPTVNMPPPAGPIMIGVYRTELNGLVYHRVTDPFWTGTNLSLTAAYNQLNTPFIGPVIDNVTDGLLVTQPELYGDGSTGAPGSLDNLCPPATPAMVRHMERLFLARGNTVWYTKQRADLVGPGYNEEVLSVEVGGSDPITGLASMDDKIVILKGNEDVYFLDGVGPGDDGSGALFQNPQPIPTDLGCVGPQGVLSGPEGVYYMSTAGLRLVTRALSVQYVGGPVEDELAQYPNLAGAFYYPSNNRYYFLANLGTLGSPEIAGELIARDYTLDAWTTRVVMNGTTQTGFVSGCVAIGRGTGKVVHGVPILSAPATRMHLMSADGTVWREHDPAADATPWFDNETYVSSIWRTPVITLPGSQQSAASMQGRFRLWDILALLDSLDPHGLIISVGVDYGSVGQNRIWTWETSGQNPIAPGGTLLTPLTQLRTYDGRMGEAFQIQIQDVADASSVSGQGCQMLGFTLAIGTYESPYKLPAPSTQ